MLYFKKNRTCGHILGCYFEFLSICIKYFVRLYKYTLGQKFGNPRI